MMTARFDVGFIDIVCQTEVSLFTAWKCVAYVSVKFSSHVEVQMTGFDTVAGV